MAFSRSGVSKVAWPIRLGLIIGFSFTLPALQRTARTIHVWSIFRHDERAVNAGGDPTALDKIDGFGESYRDQTKSTQGVNEHGRLQARDLPDLRRAPRRPRD